MSDISYFRRIFPPLTIVQLWFKEISMQFLQGRSDGELTVSAGEELVIIEDDGSGWTLVARGTEEGYVPTTYVEKL